MGPMKGASMRGKRGDQIVVDGTHLGEPAREGQILEVRGDPDDEHYLVRWDDTGHETLFYPGPTSHTLKPGGKRRSGTTETAP